MKQTPVHHTYNADLLAAMPLTAAEVVEVGCGSGALAKAYRQLNAKAEYWCIDIEPEYAAMAQAQCHRSMAMNIEQASDDFWEDAWNTDCWVFGDTLEHLVDPWRVLTRIRANLPADGAVVACVPNMQHWSVIHRLITGELHYEDAGLLDRTHLRWFTQKTMVRLFEDTGFRVEFMMARVFDEPMRHLAINELKQVATAFGVPATEIEQRFASLQYVIRAIPA